MKPPTVLTMYFNFVNCQKLVSQLWSCFHNVHRAFLLGMQVLFGGILKLAALFLGLLCFLTLYIIGYEFVVCNTNYHVTFK